LTKLRIIEEIAQRILRENPDPVVRFRLLRDVLKASCQGDVMVGLRHEVCESRWVVELKHGQKSDGSWGRLHSRSSSAKGKILTTEVAVERALALGLDGTNPILHNAVGYLTGLLEGDTICPDHMERNDRWSTGTRLFAAATLAKIGPKLSVLDNVWKLWATIAARTFASNGYDPQREINAHRELTGASIKNSYLVLNNKYTLSLLGARASHLPKTIERALVDWVWHKSGGVYYLNVPLSRPVGRRSARLLDSWFTSIELLSPFPSWQRLAKNLIDWLWAQRNEGGLWDFGSRWNMSNYFPLSEGWRNSKNRQYDYSTRVLTLLRKYYDRFFSR
jgi:hypothetical protein